LRDVDGVLDEQGFSNERIKLYCPMENGVYEM
jgi:hypothetical protein